MNCPSCSASLKPGARFCPECGATIAQPPAYTDKTMIASPPPGGFPQQGYGANQPAGNQYGQTPASGYPASGSPPAYGQQQPAVPPSPQVYNQSYQQQQQPYGYAPAAYGQQQPYAVPQNPAGFGGVPAGNGLVLAGILILCSLALIAGVFLPLLIQGSVSGSVYDVLSGMPSSGIRDEPEAASLYIAIPVLAGLSLLCSLMALWKRRQLWGVFTLLFGLVIFGFAGLLAIGLNLEGSRIEAGPAVWLLLGSGLAMFVISIVYLARKKAPR